ncbi:hypothetical protein CTI12_AA267320 [Artemisia annua]|uniref:RRM domain-containing protein n=1 Tax=Artemisia annua TaxID=35608 RepID=A0A2U1NGP0_ARTAN|nr:hypothetical protein CTI12_AA267320 [Artemisia annua]
MVDFPSQESKARDNQDGDGWTWVIGKHNKNLRSRRNSNTENHQFNHTSKQINTITYYFTNFPHNWNHTIMLDIFNKYGHAIDVYIAGKRNKDGKRFGFCRFTGVKDCIAFEKILNTIQIGTQKIKCNLARHQRKPPPRQPYNNHHNTPSQPFHNPNHKPYPTTSELKTIDSATNTHNIISDHGFDDFSIKYIGGMNLLIQFPNHEAVEKALSNNTLKTHFLSLMPWTNKHRVPNRVTWISISGIPAQLWFSIPFKPVAELWGKILIHEDCSSRQFNRTAGKVHLDLIKYTIQIPIENEVFTVRITETEEEIDSLFNGYVLSSSINDEEDSSDDQRSDGQANVDSEKEDNNDSDNIHLSTLATKSNPRIDQHEYRSTTKSYHMLYLFAKSVTHANPTLSKSTPLSLSENLNNLEKANSTHGPSLIDTPNHHGPLNSDPTIHTQAQHATAPSSRKPTSQQTSKNLRSSSVPVSSSRLISLKLPLFDVEDMLRTWHLHYV